MPARCRRYGSYVCAAIVSDELSAVGGQLSAESRAEAPRCVGINSGRGDIRIGPVFGIIINMKLKINGQYLVAGISYHESELISVPTQFGVLTLFQIPLGSQFKKDKFELICDLSETVDVLERLENLILRAMAGGFTSVPVQMTVPPANSRDGSTFISVPSTGPKELLDFMAELEGRLGQIVRRFVGVLRWRFNTDGEHNVVKAFLGARFSLDGVEWHAFPPQFQLDLEFRRDLLLKGLRAESESLGDLLGTGMYEPVYHEMIREAWALRRSNQRSCLLLAVAALETAVKQCGSALAKDSEWLLLNLPAPPVARILQKWIPELPALCKINGKVLPPPNRITKLLKDAVEARNALAHKGEIEVEPHLLRNILDAVQDTLWMLDYYQGHQWALGHVRTETIKELQTAAGPATAGSPPLAPTTETQ